MLKIFLYPFLVIYGIIVFIRNLLYDWDILKSKEFDVPVVSIGNITVGGTGKTPHVEYLAELLREKFEVVTLSRGYKRKTSGFRIVEVSSKVSEVGDEPLQIKRKLPDITVAVCENRVRGVENILKMAEEKPPDVIILDDAFQHRRIFRGINILLIDYNRPVTTDKLLPVGTLRESAGQMRRANIIIFTKCPEDEVTPIMKRILKKDIRLMPYQDLFFTTFRYQNIQPVFPETESITDFYKSRKYSVLIVTGIAFPDLIPEHLEPFSSEMDTIYFPDHHNYSKKDIRLITNRFNKIDSANKIIITTEKDAIRFMEMEDLDEELKNNLYYLPVSVKFLDNEEKMFNKKILKYVGENKSNRKLHQRKNKSTS